MNKKRVILLSIIGCSIIICLALIIVKPYVIKSFKDEEALKKSSEEIKEELKENLKGEVKPSLSEGNVVLGLNILYSGEGMNIINDDTLIISNGGTYDISGSLNNGQIIIDTHDDVVLNFQNISINNDMLSPLSIKKEDSNVTINLYGVNNLISNSDDTISTNGNITFKEEGTLNIINEKGNGIKAKNVIFEKGNYTFKVNKSIIDTDTLLTLNDGILIGLSNENLGTIDSNSNNDSIIFNLPNMLVKDDTLTLMDVTDNLITEITLDKDYKIFTYSSSSLLTNSFKLKKNIATNNESIIINENEIFEIKEKINVF